MKLFLDSGAFTAWSKGIKIDLFDYIQFIHKYNEQIDRYASLDVIPDNLNSVDKACRKGWENYQEMRKQGLNPVPTFHYNEDIRWLKKYLTVTNQIALGGLVKKQGIRKVDRWLKSVFLFLMKHRLEELQIHGFGLSSVPLMLKYPWSSVDSSTTIVASKFGEICLPCLFKDKLVYDDCRRLGVSNYTKNHYRRMNPLYQNYIIKWINSFGLTEIDLKDRQTRIKLNASFFLAVEQEIRKRETKCVDEGSLFTDIDKKEVICKKPDFDLYFAGHSKKDFRTLYDMNVQNFLITFAYQNITEYILSYE